MHAVLQGTWAKGFKFCGLRGTNEKTAIYIGPDWHFYRSQEVSNLRSDQQTINKTSCGIYYHMSKAPWMLDLSGVFKYNCISTLSSFHVSLDFWVNWFIASNSTISILRNLLFPYLHHNLLIAYVDSEASPPSWSTPLGFISWICRWVNPQNSSPT
jgi:hypothetical protein